MPSTSEIPPSLGAGPRVNILEWGIVLQGVIKLGLEDNYLFTHWLGFSEYGLYLA